MPTNQNAKYLSLENVLSIPKSYTENYTSRRHIRSNVPHNFLPCNWLTDVPCENQLLKIDWFVSFLSLIFAVRLLKIIVYNHSISRVLIEHVFVSCYVAMRVVICVCY
jgi:hypothetical protein